MQQNRDFLGRHPFLAAVIIGVVLVIAGHVLWLLGVIPDNNAGGEIL